MNYSTLSNETLFLLMKENTQVLAGAVQDIFGDDPMPDPRELIERIKDLSFEEFIEGFIHSKDEIGRTLDTQEVISQISQENIGITRELVKRYSNHPPDNEIIVEFKKKDWVITCECGAFEIDTFPLKEDALQISEKIWAHARTHSSSLWNVAVSIIDEL